MEAGNHRPSNNFENNSTHNVGKVSTAIIVTNKHNHNIRKVMLEDHLNQTSNTNSANMLVSQNKNLHLSEKGAETAIEEDNLDPYHKKVYKKGRLLLNSLKMKAEENAHHLEILFIFVFWVILLGIFLPLFIRSKNGDMGGGGEEEEVPVSMSRPNIPAATTTTTLASPLPSSLLVPLSFDQLSSSSSPHHHVPSFVPSTSTITNIPSRLVSMNPSSSLASQPSTNPSFSTITWTLVGSNHDATTTTMEGGDAQEQLGISVALSRNGTRLCAAGGQGSLRMYDYYLESESWSERPFRYHANFTKQHPLVVALSSGGDFLIVGEGERDDFTGAVHVFDHQSDDWRRKGQMLSGEQAFDTFGYSVAITDDGNRIAVGGLYGEYVKVLDWKKKEEEDNENDDNHCWSVVYKLQGKTKNGWFGVSLSIATKDGSKLVVGRPGKRFLNMITGSAYIYDLTTTADASLIQKLDGERARDRYGESVGMSSDGSRVAVGSSLSGYVKVFQQLDSSFHRSATSTDTTGGGEQPQPQYVQVGDDIKGAVSWAFGSVVAFSANGDRLAVGAPDYHNEETAGQGTGKVFLYSTAQQYQYRRPDTSWNLIGEFAGEAAGDRLGVSVALSGNGQWVAIGASDVGDMNGNVRVYGSSE